MGQFLDYHWRVRGADGSCMSVGRSMTPEECAAESTEEFDLVTPQKGHTRGVNYPGGGRRMEPGPVPGSTKFIYIITSDIKGWIPSVRFAMIALLKDRFVLSLSGHKLILGLAGTCQQLSATKYVGSHEKVESCASRKLQA